MAENELSKEMIGFLGGVNLMLLVVNIVWLNVDKIIWRKNDGKRKN